MGCTLGRMEDVWVEARPNGGECLNDLVKTVEFGGSIGLPGTKLHGAMALVELARARLNPTA